MSERNRQHDDDAMQWLKDRRDALSRSLAPNRLRCMRCEQVHPDKTLDHIPIADLPKKQVEPAESKWMRRLHRLGDIAERTACVIGIVTVLSTALWLAYLIW